MHLDLTETLRNVVKALLKPPETPFEAYLKAYEAS